MRRLPLLLLVIVLVLAVAGGAWWRLRSRASTVPTQDEVLRAVMARVDGDHDGRISREEWLRHGGEEGLFTQHDTNHDGFLDLDEFRTMFLTTDPVWLNGR